MENKISPIIDAEEVANLIKENDTVIIDARSGPHAKEQYSESHVTGAIFIDLETMLSEKSHDAAFGGRHPLPDPQTFSIMLGELGVTPQSRVIVYDDKQGANAAARCWWMLKAAGHEKVQVVDGGLNALLKNKIPFANEIKEPIKTLPYPFTAWQLPLVGIDEVKRCVADTDYVVIDVREQYRYRGEREPIDLVAGHIPGAINVPYIDNLDQNGYFLSPQELRTRYKESLNLLEPNKVIVHCGSGVTACHTLLALEHAGISGANLYVGSWSEWSRRGLPIATDQT